MIQAYTAIIGDKEEPRDDILCFTMFNKFVKPVMNAKVYKVLSHLYVDADISVWMDGNAFYKKDINNLVDEWLGDADIAVRKHYDRDCIYEEAPVCIKLYPWLAGSIVPQMEYYKKKGFPEHAGMAECNVIIRRRNKIVEQFNNAWWAEICRWSQRDQLSFPYVASKIPGLKVKYIKGNIRTDKDWEYKQHKKSTYESSSH